MGERSPIPLPHLTVAKADGEDALDRIEAEVRAAITTLLPLTQLVEAIAIEEEGEDGTWSQRIAIPLGRSGQ